MSKASTFIHLYSVLFLFSSSEFSARRISKSTIYPHVVAKVFKISRYQGVMMSADLKLSWKFLINFYAVTSIRLPQGQFLQKQFRQESILIT